MPDAGDEAKHLRRRSATVYSLPVCPVLLNVVILDEPLVRLGEPGPAFGPREVPVGHVPLYVEVRLDVRLPGPSALYLALGDT